MLYSRSKRGKTGVVTLICLAFVIAGASYYQHKCGEAKPASRTVNLTCDFTVSDIPDDARHMLIWVPVPPGNDQQKLLAIDIADKRPYQLITDSEYGNRYLLLTLSADSLPQSQAASLKLNFTVTRYAVCPPQNDRPPKINDDAMLTRFLDPDRLIPIDGKIAAEAKRVAAGGTNRMDIARSLYDNIVTTMAYDKSGSGWGRGDAIYACDIRKGNCTDFHSLFIGQARAMQIPARFIMGLPLPPEKTEGEIAGYHCWAEFFVPEFGWLPVDASEASKHRQAKNMYFAQIDENRIAFTTGRDIQLPQAAAAPLNYSIYPHVEIDGRRHDSVTTGFSFIDLPGK